MNQAKKRWINKARDKQTAIYGGVVLGELRETLRLIRNPAKLFRQGLDTYLGGVHKHARKHGRSSAGRFAADSWLQNSFGWQPLLRDIDGAARALAQLNTERLALEPIVTYGRNEALLNDSDQDSGGNYPRWWVHKLVKQENLVIIRGAIRLKTRDESPTLMEARNFGFSLDSFVPTVWELIPYSFLADYFTNIGDILSAWSFSICNVSWLNTTIVKRVSNKHTCHSPQWQDLPDGYRWLRRTFIPGSSYGWRKSVERSPLASLVPQLEFEIPGMSSTKWLNLAALARLKAIH
jgi:hypothetical protein